MDPKNNLQDVVRCTLCTTSEASMYCASCRKDLCRDCMEEHISDILNECKVIDVIQTQTIILALPCRKCVNHFQEYYKQYCKLCNNLVCAQCIASNEHDGHTLLDIAENFNSKTAVLKRDLAELQNIIYPMYKKIELEISFQKIDIDKNSKNLKTALIKHGDDMRRGINMIFNKLTSDLDNTTSEHMLILSDEEYKITQTIFEIKETINYMKTTLDSNDICNVSVFKSRNAEFRRLPHSLKVSLLKRSLKNKFNNSLVLYQSYRLQ